jgi:hypothetical protein
MVQKVLSNRRSDASDEKVIEDFMSTEFEQHIIPRDEHFERAIRVVTEKMRPKRTLHPVSYPDLRAYNWTLNVSAELPWTNPRWVYQPFEHYSVARDLDEETGKPRVKEKTKSKLHKFKNGIRIPPYLQWKQELELIKDSAPTFHNLYNEIFEHNRLLIHQIKDKMSPFWDADGIPIPYERLMLHMRAHVVGDDEPDKIRAVFGAPKLLLQSELMFIWPLQSTYQLHDDNKLLWGREIGRGGWLKILDEFNVYTTRTFISTDWSQFDKRLTHELIDIVHGIWRSYFDFSSYEPTTRYPKPDTDPERIENLWRWMTDSIKSTPIQLPNGEVWKWRFNGFGSGFQQTQLMDTFANMIMTYTILSSLGVNIESEYFKSLFQGDDSILGLPERMFDIHGRHFLDRMAEKAEHYFNAKLSSKKSYIGRRPDNLFVLGYFNTNGRPFRESEDLLRHLMFPERPQDFGRLAASAVGLAYASLGCDRQFYDLCVDIHRKITSEFKDFKYDWRALKWMKKAGMEEILEDIKRGIIPSYEALLELTRTKHSMTEAERQRSWPTKASGVDGEIIFLNSL